VTGLLTAAEVATLLRVKPSWVYAEARAERIPHLKLGRYTRFNRESIEAWAAERERPAARRAPATSR
jgi:excisionase family DNA binding protein